MKTGRIYTHHLQDIVDNSNHALRFVHGMSFAEFASDDLTKMATIMALEFVGEAARHLPKSLRAKYPTIRWQHLIELREKLIREYYAVDLDVV